MSTQESGKEWSNRKLHSLILLSWKIIQNLVILKEYISNFHTPQFSHCILINEPERLPKNTGRKKNLSNISTHNLQYLLYIQFPFLLFFDVFFCFGNLTNNYTPIKIARIFFFNKLRRVQVLQEKAELKLDKLK